MNIIKKTMIPAMLGLSALGLTALTAQADTLSDLRSQCVTCHDVIVSPSGWVLSGGSGAGAKAPSQKTVSGWASTIAAMGDGKCGFTNIGPGGTSRSVGAQFLYDKQFAAATATATFTPTPTATATATPTATTAATPTATTAATPTATTAATPTATMVMVSPTPTATMVMVSPTPTATMVMVSPTPTATMVMASPTPTYMAPACYINGTSNYKYSGKGTCHDKGHLVQSEYWCQHHMDHEDSNGNHTHAFPHPCP